MDVIYTALSLLRNHANDDNFDKIRITIVLSKITNSLFLLADHVLWLGRSDLFDVNITRWSTISNKYWLYTITLNLLRDFYEISNLLRTASASRSATFQNKQMNDVCEDRRTTWTTAYVLSTFKFLYDCLYLNNRDVTIDTVKNLCDLFIPLTSLGYVELKPSTVGLLGVISSIAGLAVLIEPKFKLTPS